MEYAIHRTTWFLQKRNWIEPLITPFLCNFEQSGSFQLALENVPVLIVWELYCLEPVGWDAEQVLATLLERSAFLMFSVHLKDMRWFVLSINNHID